ncbi:MAG TPA: hypothetical protein VK003_21065 [Oceanobacillus sp.]|nr:hypothetical protein [Oceanobacillus sp.]
MSRGYVFKFAFLVLLLVSGCSSLPGLRVLTGQEDQQSIADRTVESLDLVMADKTGSTDPALIAAADRIEAANRNVDIIEIRNDPDSRVFSITMLLLLPPPENTMEGQIAFLDGLRRAFELSWQGTMRESEGADVLRITMLAVDRITTLDNGPSYFGAVQADGEIERGAAASYLAGERSLSAFYDLIVNGTLSLESPNEFILYDGQPNHPMFALPSNN